jgi:hypothetical protein
MLVKLLMLPPIMHDEGAPGPLLGSVYRILNVFRFQSPGMEIRHDGFISAVLLPVAF